MSFRKFEDFFLQNPPKISQNDPTFRKFEANLLYLLQMMKSPRSPSFHRSPLKHAETLLGCQMGGLDHEGGEDDALCKAPFAVRNPVERFRAGWEHI